MKAAFSLFFCVLLCYGQVALADAGTGPKRGKIVRVLRIAKGEVFVLKSDVYIAKRMTLETDSKLLCAPNTRVILLPGAELLVAAGVQIGCKPGASCTWKGIRCEGQNKVTISGEPNHDVQIADAEVGIEVQNASSLTISYAKFTGHLVASATRFSELVGTGIQINGPATISNCTFTKLSRAIDIQNSDPASPPSIKANGFYENRTAIAITLPTATQATSLDLSCNIFEPGGLNASTSPPTISRTRTGLAWGINVLRGTLGNVGVAPSTTAGSYTFAANVWPANVRGGFARGQNIENMPGTDWKSPTGWTSIASAGNTKYFKYLNEFLGTSLNVGLITPLQALGEREFVLTTNQIVTPPSGISLSDYLALFDRRCDGFLGDPFVAPRSVVGGGNAAARLDLDINSTYLLQNIPNPANTETIIGYNIGHDFKEAYIEIVEAVTGRQKQYFGLKSESAKALTISLKNYPQGLYTYRLVVDGKQAAIKKMLVQP